MRNVEGEKILKVVTAIRKGKGNSNQTPFELGVGIVLDECDNPLSKIRVRTEQIDSGVAPVVGTLGIEEAEDFANGLNDAIRIAKGFPPFPPIGYLKLFYLRHRMPKA